MTTKKNTANTLSFILRGEFIAEKNNVKLIPFLLMIVALGLINIRLSFHAETLLKRSISLEKEVADIRLAHITHKSKLMSMYRRSVFENVVLNQGLRTSLNPAEIIEKNERNR